MKYKIIIGSELNCRLATGHGMVTIKGNGNVRLGRNSFRMRLRMISIDFIMAQ